MSRYNARAETRAAASAATDALWRRRAEELGLSLCEVGETDDERYPDDTTGLREDVGADDFLGLDPECPIAREPDRFMGGMLHRCYRRDGRAVRFGIDSCHKGAQIALQMEAGR